MPRTRWELTARAQLEYVARAEQLRAMGVDVKIPKLHCSDTDVDFEIGYGPNFYNIMFNSSPSRIVLLTGARIVSRRSGVYLDENIQVSLPWEGPVFELWYSDGCDDRPYRVVPGLMLDREQVLNHRLEEGIRLQRGKLLSGLLLFVAYESQLPTEYRHGAPISVRVALIDSLGTEFAAEGTVRVDRCLDVKQQPKPRTENLCEDRRISAAPQQTHAPRRSRTDSFEPLPPETETSRRSAAVPDAAPPGSLLHE